MAAEATKLRLDARIAAELVADPGLWRDFNDICDCGGRLAGTESEKRAFALLRERVRAASPANSGRSIPVPYGGWRAKTASLRLPDGKLAPCHPLVRTVATSRDGLTAQVIDLGRGTPDEFDSHAADIKGRIVLVRHELMFAAGTIHRRRKYDMARARGAVGFLIAGPLAGHVVAGSSGRQSGEGIPALGIAPETATRLARRATGFPTVTITIETEEGPAETETLLYDYPGTTDEWVVLSAHVDGHDLAESAMDNGTGLASVLAVTRALAPQVAGFRRGLRVMFFSVEEWALTGSAQYVEALGAAERGKIALNVNLDSIAGSPNLGCCRLQCRSGGSREMAVSVILSAAKDLMPVVSGDEILRCAHDDRTLGASARHCDRCARKLSTSRSLPIRTRRLAPATPRSSSSSVKRSPTRWKT